MSSPHQTPFSPQDNSFFSRSDPFVHADRPAMILPDLLTKTQNSPFLQPQPESTAFMPLKAAPSSTETALLYTHITHSSIGAARPVRIVPLLSAQRLLPSTQHLVPLPQRLPLPASHFVPLVQHRLLPTQRLPLPAPHLIPLTQRLPLLTRRLPLLAPYLVLLAQGLIPRTAINSFYN
jgi:hypothetical protein